MRTRELSYAEEKQAVDASHTRTYEDRMPPSAYEISLFIDEVEDLICAGFSIPMTSKVLIDREQCLDTIEVLRTNLPWEMLEAKRILSEQEGALERAEAEAEEIRQLAERQAAFILDQSQLVRMAEARAQDLIEEAEREAVQLIEVAKQDAHDLYQSLERELDLLVRDIKELVAGRLEKLRD